MFIRFEKLVLSDRNDEKTLAAAGFEKSNFVRVQLWGVGDDDDFYVLGTTSASVAKSILCRAFGRYAEYIAAAAEPANLAESLSHNRQFIEDAGVAQCAGGVC